MRAIGVARLLRDPGGAVDNAGGRLLALHDDLDKTCHITYTKDLVNGMCGSGWPDSHNGIKTSLRCVQSHRTLGLTVDATDV